MLFPVLWQSVHSTAISNSRIFLEFELEPEASEVMSFKLYFSSSPKPRSDIDAKKLEQKADMSSVCGVLICRTDFTLSFLFLSGTLVSYASIWNNASLLMDYFQDCKRLQIHFRRRSFFQ